MPQKFGDRELYPALLVTAAALVGVYLFWHIALGSPSFPACWIFTHWHIYCPACGGTRAMIALAKGRIFAALLYNPAVPVGAFSVAAYLLSQTVWRMRGRRGRVLRYDPRWLGGFLGLLLVNCTVRNLLWLFVKIPL